MIRECFKTNTGILFHSEGLREIGLDPATVYPSVLPRPPALPTGSANILSVAESNTPTEVVSLSHDLAQRTEEAYDFRDALSPIYDQLQLKWAWWILELIPLKYRYQRHDNTWGHWFGWNFGRGRYIPSQKINGVRVHRSVKTRMEAKTKDGESYQPRASFDMQYVTWVD